MTLDVAHLTDVTQKYMKTPNKNTFSLLNVLNCFVRLYKGQRVPLADISDTLIRC